MVIFHSYVSLPEAMFKLPEGIPKDIPPPLAIHLMALRMARKAALRFSSSCGPWFRGFSAFSGPNSRSSVVKHGKTLGKKLEVYRNLLNLLLSHDF
jgi:hypothetical protein